MGNKEFSIFFTVMLVLVIATMTALGIGAYAAGHHFKIW